MTHKQLQSLLREWQKTLRLQDWNVTAKFVSGGKIDPPGNIGVAITTLTQKSAKIQILKQGDDRLEDPHDQELTLVHELLHLHVAPFAPDNWDTPVGVAAEQAIDLIAEALVKLKRRALSKSSTRDA